MTPRLLPEWASTIEARKIVAAIVADRPTYTITRGGWLEGGGQRRYSGANASRLRKLYTAEMMRLIDSGRCADEIHHELDCTADELIHRLVPDEPLVWITAETVGDPMRKAKAA